MRTFRSLIITAAALTIAATGCGGGDDGATASDTTRYCELAREMAAPPTGIDPATATPEQLDAAIKKHCVDHLDEIDELERVAPSEVRGDISVYARAARHIAETGDIEEFDTPGNAPAIARQEAFDKKTCGIEPPGGP